MRNNPTAAMRSPGTPGLLFRLSKSKQEADLSPNTLRKWAAAGLINLYRTGRAVWVNRAEVEAHIMANKLEVR